MVLYVRTYVRVYAYTHICAGVRVTISNSNIAADWSLQNVAPVKQVAIFMGP